MFFSEKGKTEREALSTSNKFREALKLFCPCFAQVLPKPEGPDGDPSTILTTRKKGFYETAFISHLRSPQHQYVLLNFEADAEAEGRECVDVEFNFCQNIKLIAVEGRKQDISHLGSRKTQNSCCRTMEIFSRKLDF